MRRTALFLCCFGVFALWPSMASGATTTDVVVLKVEGAIDRPLLNYLDDRLASAEADGAVVVLQLDTSGTLDQDGVALGQRLVDMDVPVIAFVGPTTSPTNASGAGLLLMYASSLSAVAPGSQTGPLNPIDLAHPDQAYPGLDQTIQGWIDARGKDTSLDWDDRPLTAQDAIDLGIATEVAQSVPELLNVIDGKTVQTAAGPVTLQTRIATTEQEATEGTVNVRFDNLGPIQRVAHGVATPSMVYFLLVLGLACFAFELTQPGFGFAGFAGVGMLGLALYGLWVVPPWWPGMVLMLLGVGFMMLDVRLRRLGVFTWVGLAGFAGGSILAWKGVAPAIEISPWLIGGAVVASILYYGFALTVAIQSRDRIVNTQQGLIGLVGEARGKLAPEGPVYVKGAMWRGRTGGDAIPPGTKVRIRGVDGLVLKVEAEPQEVGAGSGPVDGGRSTSARGRGDLVTEPLHRLASESPEPSLSNNPIGMQNDLAIAWQHLAACRGEDSTYFFAPSYFERRAEKNARETVAKAICARCPVRDECLEYALGTRDNHGIWGGMNEMERRAILRARAREAV